MVMSVVLLLWIRVAVFQLRDEGTTRRGGCTTRVSPLGRASVPPTAAPPPALTDGMAPARSLLWQRPHISCHIVWNEPKWLWVCLLLCTKSSQQILLRREICTCLELAFHLERASETNTKASTAGDDNGQNYLPRTSAKLWAIQEGCENEPQLSLPAKWSPGAVNLGGIIYLHYLCSQVV